MPGYITQNNGYAQQNTFIRVLIQTPEKKSGMNLQQIQTIDDVILKWTGKIDDYLVDFSMKLARNGAWKFANEFSLVPENEIKKALTNRDQRVARKVKVILKPGWVAIIVLRIIRITERGSVAEKIRKLK
ncbi:MAG: DUF5995 family protein [Bacteroidota bacterium]|nr:DUF5995 family protein [Bacteroidota bacterium]